MTRVEEKGETIDVGAPKLGLANDQVTITRDNRKYRKKRKVLLDICGCPIDLESSFQGWTVGHDLLQGGLTITNAKTNTDAEISLAMAEELTDAGRTKGAKVSGNGNRLEEVALAGTVVAEDQIHTVVPGEDLRLEVAKAPAFKG